MSNRALEDLLSRYLDQIGYSGGNGRHAVAIPADNEQLESLLRLATQLNRAMGPVQPSPAFASRLRRELFAAARQQANKATPRAGDQPPTKLDIAKKQWETHNREILLGAAMGSLLSVAAAIALTKSRKGVKPSGRGPARKA